MTLVRCLDMMPRSTSSPSLNSSVWYWIRLGLLAAVYTETNGTYLITSYDAS